MGEKNRHILQKAIETLPQAKAPSRIWEKIEEELESFEMNRSALKNSITALPKNKAPEFVWENINAQLENNSTKTKLSINYLKIAASITLLIGLSFLIQYGFNKNSEKELLTFSKEIIEDNSSTNDFFANDNELDNVIQKQCDIQPDVCENPRFTELNKELENLTRSLDQIKNRSENSMDDPETYKYIIKIEKEKAEITKKLMQQFNS